MEGLLHACMHEWYAPWRITTTTTTTDRRLRKPRRNINIWAVCTYAYERILPEIWLHFQRPCALSYAYNVCTPVFCPSRESVSATKPEQTSSNALSSLCLSFVLQTHVKIVLLAARVADVRMQLWHFRRRAGIIYVQQEAAKFMHAWVFRRNVLPLRCVCKTVAVKVEVVEPKNL